MKILPQQYQCEICNDKYENIRSAITCENQGVGPTYPIGMVFGNHRKNSMYKRITFSIAKVLYSGHHNDSALWACRDMKNFFEKNDSLGNDMCGGGFVNLNKSDSNLNFKSPHFKRMVAYLKENKIPITIWNGEKAIPYVKSWKGIKNGNRIV